VQLAAAALSPADPRPNAPAVSKASLAALLKDFPLSSLE